MLIDNVANVIYEIMDKNYIDKIIEVIKIIVYGKMKNKL